MIKHLENIFVNLGGELENKRSNENRDEFDLGREQIMNTIFETKKQIGK